MKKKILIALLVIVVLAGGFFGYLIVNLNSIIEKYRPELERIASDALGSRVKLGKLEAGIFPNARINVSGLTLSDTDGAAEGFKLNDLVLHVKIMPILSGRLDITKLSVNSPAITLIRDQNGISIPGLTKSGGKKGAAGPDSAKPASPEPAPQADGGKSATAGLSVNLDRFEVNRAALTLRDTVTGKDVTVTDLGVNGGVAVANDVATVSDLRVTGTLQGKAPLDIKSPVITFNLQNGVLDLPQMTVDLLKDVSKVKVSFDTKATAGNAVYSSDSLQLDKYLAADSPFAAFIPPAVQAFEVKGAVQPEISADIKKDAVQAKGSIVLKDIAAKIAIFAVSKLSGRLNLTADLKTQSVESEPLTLDLNGHKLTVKFGAQAQLPKLDLPKIDINGFSGTINSAVSVTLGDKVGFSSVSQLSNLRIQEALDALKPGMPEVLTGRLTRADASVAGHTGGDVMQTLNGNVSFLAENASLIGINLAGKVLKSVNNIPLVSGALYNMVPENRRGLLDSNNTEFQSATGTVKIGGGGMTTSDLKIINPIFTLDAAGRIGFDMNMDLKASITFIPDFSLSMTSKVKELSSLLDGENRLVIPLAISGQLPGVMVVPDVTKLVEAAARKAVKDKAGDLLGETLKKKTGVDIKGLDGLLGF